MADIKKLLVAGGGYAGVEAARKLEKIFRKDEGVEITLLDKKTYQTMMTELHEVAGGRCEPESIRVRFDKIFAGRKVNLVCDEIESIDFKACKVKCRNSSLDYDYLVLGLRAEPDYFNIKGAEENSFGLWSYDDAVKVRNHIIDCFHKAAGAVSPGEKAALLTFTVAGAGFTGIELAGELMEWRKELCSEYGFAEDEVKILVVEAMNDVLPVIPKKLREKTLKFLTAHGVEVLLGAAISEVDSKGITAGGKRIDTSTIVWTCGVKGCSFINRLPELHSPEKLSSWHFKGDDLLAADDNLRAGIRKKGRLITNEFLQSVDYGNVFITGDILWFRQGHKVLPQVVETALQTGECAAVNISNLVQGRPLETFKAEYHGQMVSIGSRYAVADVMGMQLSGFPAMAAKHLVHLHYLFGIGGINLLWGYLKHRILDVKSNKSFVGGHFAYKNPGYWLVPLRMYLGVMWLIEGFTKAGKGWLNRANDFVSWQASVTAEAADALSAASDEWGEAAETAVESGGEFGTPLLSEPFFLYQWFVDAVVVKAPYLFQAGIVLAEIAIGLALLGGLFTVPAALASIALCLMFLLGAMAGPDILWFVFAALALLGGAGRQLGLDYWAMPLAKKYWNRIPFIKKHHLYLGQLEKRKNSN
jgi:NADH dehydrogenase